MFEDIKMKINEANDLIKKAVETERVAREAYLASANERRESVNEKIKELQAELDKEIEINELYPQKISEALSVANVDAAVKIEKAIELSNSKITDLNHKIELLSNALPKGEPSLFHTAIKVYRQRFETLNIAAKELNEIDTSLKKIELELKRSKESSENTQRKIEALTKANIIDDAILIEMVESFEGPIEIFGHSAGTDESAKIRYIKGNSRGIEGTPAGDKLKAQDIK